MQFSSSNDPQLGQPAVVSVLNLLLVMYLVALVIGIFAVNNPKANMWTYLLPAYALLGAFAFTIRQTGGIKQSLLRFFFFVFGANVVGYFLRCIAIFIRQRNDDLGMAAVLPLGLTIVCLIPTILGVWMLFAAIQIGSADETSPLPGTDGYNQGGSS